MGRASMLLKARTNKMLMKMLMLRRMLLLVLPMMWLLVVVQDNWREGEDAL